MWAHDPRSVQDGSTSSEKCTPVSQFLFSVIYRFILFFIYSWMHHRNTSSQNSFIFFSFFFCNLTIHFFLSILFFSNTSSQKILIFLDLFWLFIVSLYSLSFGQCKLTTPLLKQPSIFSQAFFYGHILIVYVYIIYNE